MADLVEILLTDYQARTVGLDIVFPEARDEAGDERLILRRPCATLLVTHVRAEAERLADRICRLEGRPARLVEEDQKAGAYFQLSASGVTTSRS